MDDTRVTGLKLGLTLGLGGSGRGEVTVGVEVGAWVIALSSAGSNEANWESVRLPTIALHAARNSPMSWIEEWNAPCPFKMPYDVFRHATTPSESRPVGVAVGGRVRVGVTCGRVEDWG